MVPRRGIKKLDAGEAFAPDLGCDFVRDAPDRRTAPSGSTAPTERVRPRFGGSRVASQHAGGPPALLRVGGPTD